METYFTFSACIIYLKTLAKEVFILAMVYGGLFLIHCLAPRSCQSVRYWTQKNCVLHMNTRNGSEED